MINAVKQRLYFVAAWYFRIFASMKLRRWSPRVIVVTGSAGKTTLLHLLEAQLGNKAHYSHHANSTFGICFDILGLPGIRNSRFDWLKLFLLAPFKTFTLPYRQKLYIAEADVDRPYEGKFLATLLRPEVTLWVSSLHTHTAKFEKLAAKHSQPVEAAVAAEYGEFVRATQKLVVTDGDNPLTKEQTKQSDVPTAYITKKQLELYTLKPKSTLYKFDGKTYHLPVLLPKATYYQVAMADSLLEYLGEKPDNSYKNLIMPPGRSNLLDGIKNVKIIDSTYNNSNIVTLEAMIELFETYPAEHKWLVVGDMLEQGADEADEHAKIAKLLENTHFERVIFMGPRVLAHTMPKLSRKFLEHTVVASFERPLDVYDYLLDNLKGNEVVMFKAVRFMEGVIAKLLANPADSKKLARRGTIWDKRRQEWGL